MKILLMDLRPNPFRDLKSFPVDRAKVETLKASICATDFWDNLLARRSPTEADKYEIAYGHHRLVALRELKVQSVDIPVRKLDDETMIKIMANENMVEFAGTAEVEMETIRAVVKAFAEGRIRLPASKARSKGANDGAPNFRIAPSFKIITPSQLDGSPCRQGEPPLIYSSRSVASFLGWEEKKVSFALSLLTSIEEGEVDTKDVAGLAPTQAFEVAKQARRVKKANASKGEKTAKEAARKHAKALSKGYREGAVSNKSAAAVTDLSLFGRVRKSKKPKKIPDIGKFTATLQNDIATKVTPRVKSVTDNREHLCMDARRGLADCIRNLVKYADQLEEEDHNHEQKSVRAKPDHSRLGHNGHARA